MQRRAALKNIGLLTGGMMLFPACNYSEEKATIVLKNLKITRNQEELVKNIVDTILPEDDLPGALSLGVDHFVWVMIDDMLTKDQQTSFLNELDFFDKKVRKTYGKKFVSLPVPDKLKALAETKDVQFFLGTFKNYSILGYMQSEYIMTEVMPYRLVPGTYGNCVAVAPGKRINIYG